MKETFTIPQDNRERVEKMVARFEKKADKYGKVLTAEYGEPYMMRRPVYTEDPERHTLEKVGETMIEVFDLTIESEIIQQDGYTVVAKIEHLENGNLVNAFDGDVKESWRSASCTCEHCGIKRDRKVTFIVRHETGVEKQIGRACLKDYCGIDPQMIGRLNELRDLVMQEDIKSYDFEQHPVSRVYAVVEVLAAAIHVYREQGYVKSGEPNGNRGKLSDCMRDNKPTADERSKAGQMIEALKSMSSEDAVSSLLDKIQALALNGYCKDTHFGYIAYAPAAYERYLENLKKRQAIQNEKAAERQTSEYVGQIGKRIDISIADTKLVTTFENQWGCTFLYKFVDVNGNVLIWFASGKLGHWSKSGAWEDDENVTSLRATVKNHTERDGIKQTIITRCKVA